MIEDFELSDNDFNFNLDFKMDESFSIEESFNTRYTKPIKVKDIDESQIKFEKAIELAQSLEIHKDSRQFCIVSGAFIFGDFIEALIVAKNYHVKRMTVSTLSLSQNNIDSLKNLIVGGYLEDLNMIVSTYFYSHEKGALIPYLYAELDREDKFQLAIADVHTKICMFETFGGRFIVIHGSANLRSSNCVEQFVVEENETLYHFCNEFHEKVMDKFKTIDKAVRNQDMLKIINS